MVLELAIARDRFSDGCQASCEMQFHSVQPYPFLLISIWSVSCGGGELNQLAGARGSSTLEIIGPETLPGHPVSGLCLRGSGKTVPILSFFQLSIPNGFAQASSG